MQKQPLRVPVQFVTNTFTVTDASLTPLGSSVSPPVALINHSCDPNAVVVFPRASARPSAAQEPLMHVVALREIAADEEVRSPSSPFMTAHKSQILTAYVDTTLPRAIRQA